MYLWCILFVVAIVIGIPFFKDNDHDFVYSYSCVALVVSAVIAIIVANCAPNQFKPDTDLMFSQVVCDDLVITPNISTGNSTSTSSFNLEYRIKGNPASLSEEVEVYCAEVTQSDTGYSYFERYYCDYMSPVRSFLYGSWGRPRWYYKIYICAGE